MANTSRCTGPVRIYAFWKFLWLGNLAWDFLEAKFFVQGFFGVLIFAPIRIRPSLSLEIRSTPPVKIY